MARTISASQALSPQALRAPPSRPPCTLTAATAQAFPQAPVPAPRAAPIFQCLPFGSAGMCSPGCAPRGAGRRPAQRLCTHTRTPLRARPPCCERACHRWVSETAGAPRARPPPLLPLQAQVPPTCTPSASCPALRRAASDSHCPPGSLLLALACCPAPPISFNPGMRAACGQTTPSGAAALTLGPRPLHAGPAPAGRLAECQQRATLSPFYDAPGAWAAHTPLLCGFMPPPPGPLASWAC
jgi:hypothetical protein